MVLFKKIGFYKRAVNQTVSNGLLKALKKIIMKKRQDKKQINKKMKMKKLTTQLP